MSRPKSEKLSTKETEIKKAYEIIDQMSQETLKEILKKILTENYEHLIHELAELNK